MREFVGYQQAAIRYWERRRIAYNLTLVLPGFVGYAVTDALNWAGDDHPINYFFILSLFAFAAIGANICYSFAYALEFLFGNDAPESGWLRWGRKTAFVGGLLFSMLLAIGGGANIAQIDWNWGVRQIQRSQAP